MQSCTCASGSRPSTTNIRKHEELSHEKASDPKSTEVRVVCCPVYCRLQLLCDEPVELADAGPFRLAADQLLASVGHLDPQQDPLRWVSRGPRSSLVLAAPDAGALGTDDARGTREVPPRRPRPTSGRVQLSGPGFTPQRHTAATAATKADFSLRSE